MNHRIVCTEQTECSSKGHIVAVGTGSDPSHATKRYSVSEVWSLIDDGDVFYTADDRNNVAVVRKFDCPCGRGSLRTDADASWANNLDNLRLCSWKAA